VELSKQLGDTIARTGLVHIARTTDRYLTDHELERFLRANAPQIVFMNICDIGRAVEVVKAIAEIVPAVQVVAMDRSCDPAILLSLMHNGVREFLAYPFEPNALTSTVRRLQEILTRQPATYRATDTVVSFLPAKAGVGASTLALNTAVALSKSTEQQTLLMDLDLNSGLLGFMLKLDSTYTIYEAAESSEKLDEHLWPQLVAQIKKLDVLPAGRLDPNSRIEAVQVRRLLQFARRFYGAICVDLSGNMEKFSMDVMQDSKRIFLVCTAEIPALHLARQKLQLLQRIDVGDRVAVLLNRSTNRPIISTSQIEQLLGVPVYMEFPNEYKSVHDAVTAGREVNPKSSLGKKFGELTDNILGLKKEKRPAKRRRFVEYFYMPKHMLAQRD
jgi:pilus assembly protein CpaE